MFVNKKINPVREKRIAEGYYDDEDERRDTSDDNDWGDEMDYIRNNGGDWIDC